MITAEEIADEFASSESRAVDLEIMILRLLEARLGEAVMREREACASVAISATGDFERDTTGRTVSATREGIAAAIRARTNSI